MLYLQQTQVELTVVAAIHQAVKSCDSEAGRGSVLYDGSLLAVLGKKLLKQTNKK